MMPQGMPSQGSQGGGGKPSPEEIKMQLVMLIQKAKQLADQNGVDFNAVVAEAMKGGGGTGSPMPPPPGNMPQPGM